MTGKIAVLGAGANGASIGADLARAGHDVTLIEQWPEHVEAIRKHGVHVDMPDVSETTPINVINLCEVATLRQPFDVVFLLMKAYDTRWACELIKPHLTTDGLVVGVQNGMTVDTIAGVVGDEHTIGSVIEIASTMFDAGVVRRDTTRAKTWFAVGAIDPVTSSAARHIADLLTASGNVEVSNDIRSAKWMKLVANATELVPSAILDMSVMEAVTVPGVRDFMIEAGREAARTAVDLGHRIVPIFGMTDDDVVSAEEYPEILLSIVHDDYSIPGQMTTVLQDWVKGRHSEVNELNGLIVDERRRLGGNAPANERIVDIARRIEIGELERGIANVEHLLRSTAH